MIELVITFRLIVCIGEGEEAMTELCNNMQYGKDIKSIKNLWVKENGNIFKNPPKLVREEQFAKVVEAGCRNISVGVESGDPKIRKEVLGRIYKNDQVINVISLSHKYKIRSSTFNMIGLPHEYIKNHRT